MSTIGTGIAAGVAQTAQQSQSVARASDKRRAEATRQQAETNDRVEVQLRTGATADADAELPDHQAAGYEQLYRDPRDDAEASGESSTATDQDGVGEAGDADRPMFGHVDVEA